jgi:Ca2+-dependent lipid-binding protein
LLRIAEVDHCRSSHHVAFSHLAGKSDPFAVFSLNGSRVFKSQTKKKTLNPDWHESFVVGVVSVLLLCDYGV